MAKRTTMGMNPLNNPAADPLDAIISGALIQEVKNLAEVREKATRRSERVTVNLPNNLAERLRNAAYETRIPLGRLAEAALVEYITKLEQDNGGEFPARAGALTPGRPLAIA